MRLQVHPSPEIESWDTESLDANYGQIKVVVVDVVGAAAAHGFCYGCDHPNLFA